MASGCNRRACCGEWCSLQKSTVNIPNDGPVPYGALSVVIGKPGSSFRGQEITISVFRETRKEQYHAINTPTCLIAVFRWENDSNEKLAVGAVQSLLRLGLPVRPHSGIWLCVAKARLVGERESGPEGVGSSGNRASVHRRQPRVQSPALPSSTKRLAPPIDNTMLRPTFTEIESLNFSHTAGRPPFPDASLRTALLTAVKTPNASVMPAKIVTRTASHAKPGLETVGSNGNDRFWEMLPMEEFERLITPDMLTSTTLAETTR